MAIYIEVLGGAQQGPRTKVRNGMTLGRSQADIIVADPKVSSTHAKFTLDGKGMLVLTDLESANGIHINGRRVKKVALLHGVTFEVGRTKFKVLNIEDEPETQIQVNSTWRNILSEEIADLSIPERMPALKVRAFTPALKLSFIQGIQTDQEIILGYGPRKAGAESLDIELTDEAAPLEAFELHPVKAGVEIRTPVGGPVLVNEESSLSKVLKDGDLISYGTTLIKVSYL